MTVFLLSCTKDPPHQPMPLVLFLVVLVFGAPAVSYLLKRRDSAFTIVGLIVQVLAYVVYEIGISMDIDNRADLVFMYPLIALNAWIVFGDVGSPGGVREASDALPGVSIPLDERKCEACGTTYPSPDDLRPDGSGRRVCSHCGGSA